LKKSQLRGERLQGYRIKLATVQICHAVIKHSEVLGFISTSSLARFVVFSKTCIILMGVKSYSSTPLFAYPEL
jgi:hypothetical protein